ncbi:DUF5988 family protein [Jiangella asiatica]|uniref:Uncharacterized protein n=1 Tax=Jiangella asiatica TaxID=2530372 RepID=A0A4R5DAE8_9ACTN|nr:DUF5988 family protein [Jiangella asiatica]TDE10612.1 hypothetical protein E1269_11060 [Jiangella asiatica]
MTGRGEAHDVEVELVGCTGIGPRIAVDRSAVVEGRLKILFGAGYEHFDLHHFIERNGESVPVFVWTDRTWIAE